jgi:HAD superfamily hydrolase (TIGR01490 family)
MKKFAVFDIDGTLIRWQLYHAIVDKLAKRDMLGENAHKKLHDARMVWKRRENSKAFRQYEIELISIYESVLTTIQPSLFDEIVEEVAREYTDQTYVFTRELANKLNQKGYFLLAISGSHNELIAHVAKRYNFDDWIGTTYERSNGKFNGSKHTPSLNKQAELETFVSKHNLTFKDSYAIGDSINDTTVLKMVDNPIAFNPDQELFNQAQKHHWPIVIERKNVIYQLHYKDGHYTLV